MAKKKLRARNGRHERIITWRIKIKILCCLQKFLDFSDLRRSISLAVDILRGFYVGANRLPRSVWTANVSSLRIAFHRGQLPCSLLVQALHEAELIVYLD